jgi:RNA polymerase sigma-70 factor, ECF subfamily
MVDTDSGAMTANVHRRGIRASLESEPALEVLYVRYHAFVRRALREHYVDPSELEDMTQQVFLVLLRRVDEASEKRSIAAWLYQIARRVAANHLRGRRRLVRKHGELAVRAGAPVSDAGDPEQRYAREQAWSFIRDFLESLDEEACAVFVMSEIEGLRGAEIAARLRLSLSGWPPSVPSSHSPKSGPSQTRASCGHASVIGCAKRRDAETLRVRAPGQRVAARSVRSSKRAGAVPGDSSASATLTNAASSPTSSAAANRSSRS